MSAEPAQQQTQQTQKTDTDTRSPAEEWCTRVGSYWGRVLVLSWRTVFPPREDYR